MSRRLCVSRPLAAGLLAATAAFTVVAIATGSETTDADIAGLSRHGEGRAVFARVGCGSCHRLGAAGSDGEIGPDLDERLAHHTRASLTAKILDPSQGLGEGFSVMPLDFGSRLTGDELDALVDFLLAARRSH
jgi:mono/diheme cytochrome c family protein